MAGGSNNRRKKRPQQHQQGKKPPPTNSNPSQPSRNNNSSNTPAAAAAAAAAEDEAVAEDRFRVELHWCVQQLEAAMGTASPKDRDDMAKAHRTLTSGKTHHIKKRQVMSSLFGDYRTKMTQQEAKMKIELPKLRKTSSLPSRSVFFRKSAVRFSEHSTSSREPGNPQLLVNASCWDKERCPAADDDAVCDGNSKEANDVLLLENVAQNLSLEDSKIPDKAAAASRLRFTRSDNSFKFNFLVS